MATIKKVLVNPRRKKAAPKPAARKRKTNPVLTVYGAVNPKKGNTVKQHKTAPKKRAPRKVSKNPKPRVQVAKHNPFKRAKRRNPAKSGGFVKSVSSVVKTGLLTLTGLEITRQIPQLLLADQNTGAMGYAANAATIAATAFAVSKTLGKDAGTAVAVGGVVYLLDRIITEQFSAAGNLLSLSGLGDFQAHVRTTPRVPGMAGIRQGSFPMPMTWNKDGSAQVPDYIQGAISSAVPVAPPTSALSGAYGPRR